VAVNIRLCNLDDKKRKWYIRAAESRLRKSQSDELVGLFPYLFSPSQPYTTPVFIFVPTTLSPRPIGTTPPAQCTPTIGNHPVRLARLNGDVMRSDVMF